MTRNVVITGGTGGLGTALIRRLARQDYRLAATYLLPAEAEEFEKEFDTDNDRILLRRVDATNPEQVKSLFDEVAQMWGAIHGVCALVGGWAGGRDVEETDDVRLERMIDLNLRSAFYTVRAALPHLTAAEWGRIVLVGSRAAIENPPSQAAFNIAKAGVETMTRNMAFELGPYGISVNCVAPGNMAERPGAEPESWWEPAARQIPFGRVGNGDDIAAAVLFFCLPESEFTTGQTLLVDGGHHTYSPGVWPDPI